MRPLALLLLLLCALAHAHADDAPTAALVLASARAAQGGAAWDGVRTVRLTGTLSMGGLRGPATSLTDLPTGRFVDTLQLGPMKDTSGFDGRQAWSQDASGQARVDDGDGPRATAFTEAYRRAQAWWFPARRAGEVKLEGQRREGGRTYHVLAVTPAGGRRFELWVDAATHLFDRVVEQVGVDVMTTRLSDWRPVGGVRMPFHLRTSRAGDEGPHDQVVEVATAELDVPAPDAAFALPAPPPPDSGIAGGAASTTVPFTVANGHLYVVAKLNGRPYRLLLDSGGMNLVAPAVARELGLPAEGRLPLSGTGEKVDEVALTRIDRLEIGDAFLERQAFLVYSLDPGARTAADRDPVEGEPIPGLVGYEVFKRFVARIDYERGLLTLFDPARFRYQGPGAVVPFRFAEHIPEVQGELDGLPGTFQLDTGARSSLTVTTPFATRHGLYDKLGAGPARIGGWGVGGPSRERMARAGLLKLGPVEIPGPVTGLSVTRRGLADPEQAGNVGYGVLSRFTLYLDYGRQQVIFEKNGRFDRRDPADRSGLWLHLAADGWEVHEAVPGSPADEAGLASGDRILSVDGAGPEALSLTDLRARLRETPAGTALALRVRRAGVERQVRLVLRDLVP